MNKKFFCQYCMKDFDSGKECALHEKEHSAADIQKILDDKYVFKDDFNAEEIFDRLTEKLHENPNYVVCPECSGIGGYEGTDPNDWSYCHVCNGHGYVKARIQMIYINRNGKQYYYSEND